MWHTCLDGGTIWVEDKPLAVDPDDLARKCPLSFTEKEWRIIMLGLAQVVGNLTNDEEVNCASSIFDKIEETVNVEFYEEELEMNDDHHSKHNRMIAIECEADLKGYHYSNGEPRQRKGTP